MAETDKIYRYFSDPLKTTQSAAGSDPMTSNTNSSVDTPFADSLSTEALSIALIGPDELTRRAAADALRQGRGNEIREFAAYPADLDEVPKLLDQHFDVIIIDLDTNPEYALELVESLCANGSATVMVFSSKPDSEMLVRCMRAGAREFLTPPFAQATMAEALVRAAARRPAGRTQKKTRGKLLVFLGAKGGAGVTTLACNFAVALAQNSRQSTLLIDLDLPLGDAALNLGIIAEYSTINALMDYTRLDPALLEKLIVKHSSGVWVLAAPGRFPSFHGSNEAIDKLINVARQGFDNVVVDVGSKFDSTGTLLYREATTVYLVTQAGIPEFATRTGSSRSIFRPATRSLRSSSTATSKRRSASPTSTSPRRSPGRHSGRSPTIIPRYAVCRTPQRLSSPRTRRFPGSSRSWPGPLPAWPKRNQKRKASSCSESNAGATGTTARSDRTTWNF